ncbi:hypothetical protein VoSk93_35610 [Vibrio owensii]
MHKDVLSGYYVDSNLDRNELVLGQRAALQITFSIAKLNQAPLTAVPEEDTVRKFKQIR